MNMKTIWEIDAVSFKIDERGKVTTSGLSELSGRSGIDLGEGMAMFFSGEYGNNEVYMANTQTGKVRKFADKAGNVLVEMSDIDIVTIRRECENGYGNAQHLKTRYGSLNRWDDYKDGLCALMWTLYPDGRYFEDGDGFGGKDCDEENVFAIVNTDLEIVKPFTFVEDIRAYLKQIRDGR